MTVHAQKPDDPDPDPGAARAGAPDGFEHDGHAVSAWWPASGGVDRPGPAGDCSSELRERCSAS